MEALSTVSDALGVPSDALLTALTTNWWYGG